MSIFIHLILFLLGIGIIWYFAGIIIDIVARIAKRLHQNAFVVAFFFLGLLTSISEISVAINSSIEGSPQISIGNLVGASFVLLVFIVPILAVLSNGIRTKKFFSSSQLLLILVTIALPSLLVSDGSLSTEEGLGALLLYLAMVWFVRKRKYPVPLEEKEPTFEKQLSLTGDIVKIVGCGICIFLAGHLIVEESIYFAEILSIAPSVIGIILLSIGTNIPELTIAIRSIIKRNSEVAFGDYLGSATMNTLIFSLLGITGGSIVLQEEGFLISFLFMIVGFTLFYIFMKSKETLSKQEGIVLVFLYLLFLATQLYSAFSI